MSDQQQQELDQLSINTLRFLAVDAVEKAKTGHPGAPLGCAPIAYLLYTKLMKYDPTDPKWTDRDRFVLSNGHASALLYGVLHLAGYDLPMAQLEAVPPVGLAHARATRSTARRRALKSPPARSARVLRWPSASRSRRSTWPRSTTSDDITHVRSTTTPTSSAAMAT